ncbi:transcriptional regulator with XRE-family HTH domain [Paenibacillus turicensis]|uniref:Transcriptional regulator with XRE-family HTH domain n=1 Tax=Paenibacillus turicensis TaxID=160487 RepID=A0ABS4FT03_9BACL|nr:helix-turn-helix transcriptional regulator [Paenibacillus turicensis]MBP1905686.1 transcriptional regulator with XRE-family HTH domain [Paenibacillus turicensis]
MKVINRRHTPYTKFKAFLSENGVKQSDVALLLGKSKPALNQNLNGTGGDFSLSEVRKICLHYKISADEYFLRPQVSNTKQITA